MCKLLKPPTLYATSTSAKELHLAERQGKRVNRSTAIVIRRGTYFCPALYACTQRNI